MSEGGRTRLVAELDSFLARSETPRKAPSAPAQLHAAVSRISAMRVPAMSDQDHRRRIRNVVSKLQSGQTWDIGLGDLRLALFTLRDDPIFANSTFNRNRLISEAITRRGRAPVNMLFQAFFRIFDPASSETRRVYDYLGAHRDELRSSARAFVEQTDFFAGKFGILALLKSCDLNDPGGSLARAGLTEALQDTAYGFLIKCLIVDQALARYDDEPQLLNYVLGWIELGAPQRSEVESSLYLRLLGPFFTRDPKPELASTISRFLVSRFGDPRTTPWPNLPNDTGRLKRDKCLALMDRLLSAVKKF